MLLPLPPSLKIIIKNLDLDFLYFDKLLEKLRKELFKGIMYISFPEWKAYIGIWERFVQAVVLEKDGTCKYNKRLFDGLKKEIIALEQTENFSKEHTISLYEFSDELLLVLKPYLISKSEYGKLESDFADINKIYKDIVKEKINGCFSVHKQNQWGIILLKEGQILNSYKVIDGEYTDYEKDAEPILLLAKNNAVIEIFSESVN